MAIGLTSKEVTERAEHVEALRKAWQSLTDAITNYNAYCSTAFGAVEVAFGEYNKTLDTAGEFATGIRDRAQDAFDEKSEAWQEGEKGEAVSSFIDDWTLSWEELEINEPDPLDVAEPDHAQELEDAPEDPA